VPGSDPQVPACGAHHSDRDGLPGGRLPLAVGLSTRGLTPSARL